MSLTCRNPPHSFLWSPGSVLDRRTGKQFIIKLSSKDNRSRSVTITFLHGCFNEADHSAIGVGKIITTWYLIVDDDVENKRRRPHDGVPIAGKVTSPGNPTSDCHPERVCWETECVREIHYRRGFHAVEKMTCRVFLYFYLTILLSIAATSRIVRRIFPLKKGILAFLIFTTRYRRYHHR